MDAQSTQRRLVFLQFVYRQTLTGVNEALALSRLGPLTAAEKETIFGNMERGVWALPDAWFAGVLPEGWEEEYSTRDAVTSMLEDAVTGVLTERRPKAPPSQ